MRKVTKSEYIENKVNSTSYFNQPVKEWLESFPSIMSVRSGAGRLNYYLEWLNKTDLEIIQEYKNSEDKREWNKETAKTINRYMLDMQKIRGWNPNTARSSVSSVRGFFSYHTESVKMRRGSIPKPQRAQNKHYFTQSELKKMFYCADLKEKAVLVADKKPKNLLLGRFKKPND